MKWLEGGMKMPSIRSLYGRIFTIFWLTQLLVLIAVLFAQHHDPRVLKALPTELHSKLQDLADEISTKAAPLKGGFVEELTELGQRQNEEKKGMQWFFTSETGQFYNLPTDYYSRPIRNFITLSDDLATPQSRLYGRRMLAGPFLVKVKEARAFLYVGLKWQKPLPFYIQLIDKPFHLLLVTMLISTPLLLWLSWAVSRPARRLQAAADRVRSGSFETDALLEKGPLEFRRAGASFNQMVSAINQNISGQQRLLSDISHELRSPLTRLRMANALAVRKQGQSTELSRIDTEAERMEQMISDLLSLSRMQIDSQKENAVYSIKTLWKTLLDDAQFEASQQGKNLRYSSFPEAKLIGNSALLASALENVVRNAIKYAKQEIEVDFVVSEQQISVSISDDGDGVPEALLQDIFRPFFRVSTARDRESGGTGLGLAITESAVIKHQGTLNAKINPKGGLTVTLCFNRFI